MTFIAAGVCTVFIGMGCPRCTDSSSYNTGLLFDRHLVLLRLLEDLRSFPPVPIKIKLAENSFTLALNIAPEGTRPETNILGVFTEQHCHTLSTLFSTAYTCQKSSPQSHSLYLSTALQIRVYSVKCLPTSVLLLLNLFVSKLKACSPHCLPVVVVAL